MQIEIDFEGGIHNNTSGCKKASLFCTAANKKTKEAADCPVLLPLFPNEKFTSDTVLLILLCLVKLIVFQFAAPYFFTLQCPYAIHDAYEDEK
jgi:hypothetical protein